VDRVHVLEGGVVDESAEEAEHDQPLARRLVRVGHLRQRQRQRRLEREHLVLLLLSLQLVDKVVGPVLQRELGDVLGHKLVALLALLLGHVQRLVDGARDLVRVERVDEDGARAERLRAARELRQDKDAVVALLARDKLEGDLRHALAQRRDERNVGEEVERTDLEEVHLRVEVVDGRVRERREAAVDPANELVHLVAQLLVARRVILWRRRDLHEHNLLRPLRVGVQKLLECDQLVRDPLDIVHPIDTKDQLLAIETPLQLDHLVLQLRRRQHPLEACAVDTDREGVDGDGRPLGGV